MAIRRIIYATALQHRNHVSSWDFVLDRTNDGRPLKIRALVDEYTKGALALYPAPRIRSQDVIDIIAEVVVERGVPKYIRTATMVPSR